MCPRYVQSAQARSNGIQALNFRIRAAAGSGQRTAPAVLVIAFCDHELSWAFARLLALHIRKSSFRQDAETSTAGAVRSPESAATLYGH
jgi:hypothetical protein